MKEGEGRGKGRKWGRENKQEVTMAEEIKGLCITGQFKSKIFFSDGNPATLRTSQYWDSS